MILLKLNTDKSLTLTSNSNIYKLENNSDRIWVILPTVINNISLVGCTILLKVLNQDNIGSSIPLTPEAESYKGYLQCIVPITKDWTYKAGDITLWIKIIQPTNELILKTSEAKLKIYDSREADGVMPEQSQTSIDQLIIDIAKKPNISDATISETTTYSSAKIEAILSDVSNPLSATFSVTPSTVELGGYIPSATLTWTYNKNIASQTIDGLNLDASLRTYIYNTEINTQKTFTLKAITDVETELVKTATINFYNGVYYGKSTSVAYDYNLINSLTKVLSNNKARTITVSASTNEYIYYCIPTRLGIPTFTIGGFVGGFSKVDTISFPNNSNYIENYDIYKSDNPNLGTTIINIS